MTHRIVTFFLLLALPALAQVAQAQDAADVAVPRFDQAAMTAGTDSTHAASEEVLTEDPGDGFQLAVFAGYTAYNLSNPGIHLGVEKLLAQADGFSVYASLAFDLYSEIDIQTGAHANLRYGTRYTLPFGLLLECALGASYEHYFYAKRTFESDNGQSSIEEKMLHAPAFAPNIALGVGYDFAPLTSVPLLVYARPALYWRLPDRNLFFQNAFVVEGGAAWVFDL